MSEKLKLAILRAINTLVRLVIAIIEWYSNQN